LKTFAGTAGLRISGQLCTIVSGIFFARLLGPEEYGKYSLILSIIAISVLPATAGLPELIIREISKYRVGNKCFKLNGILVWSLFFVLVTSTVCCVILMALSSNNIFSEDIN
ncbi:oligosaccharide flippase family protein, partial [Vibrio sp. 10N.261.52.A1]